MRKLELFTTVAITLFLGLALLAANPALAKVKGVCSDCHTMHNSQNGSPMNFDGDSDPNQVLLRTSGCLGCHGNEDHLPGGTAGQTWPIVNQSTSAPTVANPSGAVSTNQMTAGGNFYWVENGNGYGDAGLDDDVYGHNVQGLTNDADGELTYNPPGYDSNYTDIDSNARFGGSPAANKPLTCAGTNGCHGTADTDNPFGAIAGGHHSNIAGVCDGSDLAHSYRFLYGIKGIEDNDWEYTCSDNSTDHNQYRGDDRSNLNATATNKATISYLCCECHGAFHTADNDTASASPWIRHPTDFDIGDATGTEYEAYNGASNAASAPYSVIAPVASTDAGDSGSTAKQTVNVTRGGGNGTAIVMCLSCHRAHGSPFPDILRWNYNHSSMEAAGGAGNTGCFICHTTKDDS